MRICMLIYSYWPHKVGGAENQCRRLSSELAALDKEITVLTGRHEIDWSVKEKEGKVLIRRIATFETLLKKIKMFFGKHKTQDIHNPCCVKEKILNDAVQSTGKITGTLAGLAAWLVRYLNIFFFCTHAFLFFLFNRSSFVLIHVHTAEWIAGLAAFSGKFFNIPVVCKGADMPVFPPLHAVPLSTCCDIWRRKPHFIALTQAMKDNLVQNGVSDNRITVIPNGVKLPDRTATPSRNSHFLYIGNFSQSAAHKSFDILIEAWAKIHRLRPDTKLFMLGGGNADEWTALADSLGCDDSIEFLGYRKKLTPFFLQTCCLLLPSRKEGISNALLEAQSFGLPAIVSDIPGNREIILHEINGLIVPVENSDALAAACIHLLDNPLLREKYGYAARKRIEELYSMERIADLTVNLYKELLHGAKV
ncbi:MAG: glycosyltransferase family 1 protein [Candidatus Electrothrix sp. AS4_5]|nr:glycosyltransferase family 1 protein [Candidatus Electrothrix gigas]MCI5190096.1 glycosyltransferase family 1 protein [Candidatus Electrothrix gigas]